MKWLTDLLFKLFSFFIPKEEQFFCHFLEMLEIVKESIVIFKEVTPENTGEVISKIRANEAKSDEQEYIVQQKLKKSITTPSQLSRESILTISSTIDNVMDDLKSSSKRLQAGGGDVIVVLREGYEEFWQMLDKLQEGAELSIEIMNAFADNRIAAEDPRLKRIHDLENEIDALHLKYITGKLYRSEMEGKDMLVLQLVTKIEGAADELQRLAKIVQGVLVSG